MASSILSLVPGLTKQKFTVKSDTGTQILSNIKVVSVEICDESTNADVPIQSVQNADKKTLGSIAVLDLNSSKVISPSILRLTAIAPDQSTVDQLLLAFLQDTILFNITSRSISMKSACISELEITQDANMINASRIEATFEQCIPDSTNGYSPSMSGDASVYGINVQVPSSITSTVSDLYNKVSSVL